jgi:hypothetical protein
LRRSFLRAGAAGIAGLSSMSPLWRAAGAAGTTLSGLPTANAIGWGRNNAGPLSQDFRGSDQVLPVEPGAYGEQKTEDTP